MNKLFSLSVRSQLFFVVSLLAVFSTGIIVYSGLREREETLAHARLEAESLATVIAVQQQILVSSTRQLMDVLSQMPELKRHDASKLEVTLGEIIKLNPQYSTIFVTDRTGEIWASALPTKAQKIADRESFEKALSSRQFSSGQYRMGQYSGKKVLSFYYPYKGDSGEIDGVAILGIDLDYHKQLWVDLQMPDLTNYLLLDHEGVILSGGGGDDLAGQSYEANAFAGMKGGPELDTLVAVARDGRKQIISYRKLYLAGEKSAYMYVRAGIPVEPVLAQANKVLIRNLGVLMSSLLVVLFVAWIIGKRSITDRVALLEKTSLRLAEGDLTVRVADLVSGGELGSLGRTFDHMARQLSLREQDVQDREKSLSQTLSLQHATIESTADGILVVDKDGGFSGCNRKFLEMWRIPDALVHSEERNRILGLVEEQMVKPDGALAIAQVPVGQPGAASPEEIILKDGRVLERYSQPQLLGEQIAGRVWSFRDVTGRKKAEESLRESRATLRQVLDTVPQSIFWKDRESVYLGCNEVFARTVGLDDPGKIAGKTDFDLPWPREEAEAYRRDDREVMTGNVPKRHIIEPLQQADGTRCWIDTTKVPLLDGRGAVYGVLGVYEDVTERRLAEEALRRSEEFIRRILDTVDESFLVIDRDYTIVTANKAYCSQVGLTVEGIIGKHCYEVSHGLHTPCFEAGEECAVKRVFGTGEPHTVMHHHADRAGATVYVETKAFPMRDGSGRVNSVIETITNITERHLLEEERLKRQKLEAVGTLAGGIAHDFRNLLQGVFGFMSMAKQGLGRQEHSHVMLEQAEQALQMTVNLTSQLLTFSKGGGPARRKLDLLQVIETATRFALSGSRSNYQFSYDHEVWPVDADAGQIAQVIQNIVLNANEAMPEGGTVGITARNLDLPAGVVPSLPEGGRFVAIAVKDTGKGIPEWHRSKIFDPYFTTKSRGSGLGLATSYSIVKNHGGTIDVKSEEGKGSEFIVYLPASEHEATAEAPPPISAPGRTGRLLVMDDEEVVRQVASLMIEALGHEVSSAKDGEEAIEQFKLARQSGRPFDVVILDLTVKGGMGGEQAAARIHEIDPEVKLVVSSGYSDSSVVSDYRSHGFAATLSKPYVIDDLKNCLSSLLP